MTNKIDVKEIEKKAWKSHFEDGLWEIFLGWSMFGMGMRLFTGNVWFYLVALAPWIVFPAGRRFVSIPRRGFAKFSQTRKVRQKKAVTVTAISMVVVLAFLLIAQPVLELSRLVTASLLGILVALIIGILAYYMDFGRLYVYGLLFAASIALTEAFGDHVGSLALIFSGSVILLIGVVQLLQFLRTYPLPE